MTITSVDGRCLFTMDDYPHRQCVAYHGHDRWPLSHRDLEGVFTVENEDGSVQIDLFALTRDAVETKRRRDAGMATADANADPEWKDHADAAIALCVKMYAEFTSDDVWVVLDSWGIERPKNGKALGPRMIAAAKAGLIVNTHHTKPTTQPKSHGSPAYIWRRR